MHVECTAVPPHSILSYMHLIVGNVDRYVVSGSLNGAGL